MVKKFRIVLLSTLVNCPEKKNCTIKTNLKKKLIIILSKGETSLSPPYNVSNNTKIDFALWGMLFPAPKRDVGQLLNKLFLVQGKTV